jgi:hypothetical protein
MRYAPARRAVARARVVETFVVRPSKAETRSSNVLTSCRNSGNRGITAWAFIQVSCGMTGAPDTI